MSSAYKCDIKISKHFKNSFFMTLTGMGVISTLSTVAGVSLGDIIKCFTFGERVATVLFVFIISWFIIYGTIGIKYKNKVKTVIRKTPVSIINGDIFEAPEFRVIGCDTCFRTEIDDVVISKKSLHGQLVLKHGESNEINVAIKKEASRLGLCKNSEGLYEFPLGTIIRYDSSEDHHTYLMLAMTKLNGNYESHTNMSEFENMLMKMWKEIDRVYAGNDVVLPLLGAGISRFDDGAKEYDDLLRCMLCTLNGSGVTFSANIKIIVYENTKDIPLYEYKDIFSTVPRR